MKNKNWPTKADPAKIKRIFQERITIRPTVKLQEKANIIFSTRQEWESKEISLKTLWNENFKEYVKDLDLYRKTDSKKFYQIIQSFLKYKNKGKLVKGINEGDRVIYVARIIYPLHPGKGVYKPEKID